MFSQAHSWIKSNIPDSTGEKFHLSLQLSVQSQGMVATSHFDHNCMH